MALDVTRNGKVCSMWPIQDPSFLPQRYYKDLNWHSSRLTATQLLRLIARITTRLDRIVILVITCDPHNRGSPIKVHGHLGVVLAWLRPEKGFNLLLGRTPPRRDRI